MLSALDRLARQFAYGNGAETLGWKWAKVTRMSVEDRYRWHLVARPNYAWGALRAARAAKALGYDGVTLVEFGVAEGLGITILAEHAAYARKAVGIEVDVVGFDTGKGLPASDDPRDCPWVWSEGDFVMDEPALRSRLGTTELVLGNIADTLPGFRPQHPVGFVSLDVDYYSSTLDALQLFAGPAERTLPRVACYVDDMPRCVPQVGPLAAVAEFNTTAPGRFAGPITMLRDYLPWKPPWADQIIEAHIPDHPLYRQPLPPELI